MAWRSCRRAAPRVAMPVGGLQADAARHVARHDRGLAGDVPAHVARDQARAQVVVAAGRGRDDHADRLAAVEIGDRLARHAALTSTAPPRQGWRPMASPCERAHPRPPALAAICCRVSARGSISTEARGSRRWTRSCIARSRLVGAPHERRRAIGSASTSAAPTPTWCCSTRRPARSWSRRCRARRRIRRSACSTASAKFVARGVAPDDDRVLRPRHHHHHQRAAGDARRQGRAAHHQGLSAPCRRCRTRRATATCSTISTPSRSRSRRRA